MGLEAFQSEPTNKYKRYSGHEYDERIEDWEDSLEDRFPKDLNIDFVEISPKMSKHNGMAYRRDGNTYFIRLSENYVDNSTDKEIKLTLLHEMVHIYFHRMGYHDTNHDKYFRWVAGRVGASMTRMSIKDKKWQDCIEPFLEEDA